MTSYARPIVALDVPSAGDAVALARRLADDCHFFKIGSELFTAAGPSIVRELRDRLDADVFLDLKYHDIPNTVAAAVRNASALGVRLLTVHASGGRAMLEAAQEAAGPTCGVLGVTVLTSLDGPSLASAWGRGTVDVEEEVLRLAADSAAAGLHGIVCSGAEAQQVYAAHGDRLALLVPGIRLEGSEANDQRRVVTPHGAQRAGARYIVVGRTVTAAKDPRAAFKRVLMDLAKDTVDGLPALA
jgi:orotidine-5'-phosphate decarboxylase